MDDKTYYVVRKYKRILPSVIFSTCSRDDAFAYAQIMHRTDGYDYSVLCDLG